MIVVVREVLPRLWSVEVFKREPTYVDEIFVQVGGKAYLTADITGVEVRETPRGVAGYAWFWIVGLASAVFAVIDRLPGLAILAIACALLGWLSWTRRGMLKRYRLFVTIGEDEHLVGWTNDPETMSRLHSAITDAIKQT